MLAVKGDYLTSDEAVDEGIAINECTFTEGGQRRRRRCGGRPRKRTSARRTGEGCPRWTDFSTQ